MKRLIRICTLALLLCILISAVFVMSAAAATETTQPEQYTSNWDRHEYYFDRWAMPITSYLIAEEDGTFTRVEDTPNGVVVETYDSNYQFVRGIILPREGYYFGGFHNGEEYNFLVFGCDNPDENDIIPVIIIVRYSKSWERMDSVSLYGANTTVPFDAGTVRFAEYGGYLYIRTAHEMYMTSDGLNHQANLMINLRIKDMTITESLYEAKNINWGYVTHSFNQFIAVDGTNLVAVDHGDAYPRSVVLTRYYAPAGQDTFLQPTMIDLGNGSYIYHRAEAVDVLPIAGAIGDNETGVELGGFEVSDTHYMIAGNTVSQGDDYDPNGQRNIFVAAVDKANFTSEGVTIRYLTEHSSGVTVSNPHFVQVGTNRYCILWEETDSKGQILKYAFIDSSGKLEGNVYLASGQLSDCTPVVAGNQLVWYVTSVSAPAFHSISLESPGDASHTCTFRFYYTNPPTYNYTGALASKCTVCGKAGDYAGIPPLSESSAYNIVYDPAPTCTESGIGYYTWKDAALYGVAAEVYTVPVSAYGHSYADGLCTVCGAGDPNIQTTSGKCGDNVFWSYDEAGTLTITGTGPMWNYSTNASAPWHFYTEEITTVIISDSVTTIGNCAFEKCGKLASVRIPDSVTKIGDFAFSNCSSLDNVILPVYLQEVGTMVFFNCSSLSGITVPASVTKMDNNVFEGCTSLKEVYFYCPPPGCYDLFDAPVTLYYDYRNAEWGNGWVERDWEDELTLIPYDPVSEETLVAAWRLTPTMIAYLDKEGILVVSGTGSMPDWEYSDYIPWYSYNDQINTVIVGNGVTRIGDLAFCGLPELTAVTMADTVKVIGYQAFQASGLISIDLPNGLERIEYGAFYDCDILYSVTIPDTVSEIGPYAFYATSLSSIKLPKALTKIEYATFASCVLLSSIELPDGITTVADYAFYCCYSLGSISLPNSVDSIGAYAFAYCSGLTSAELPEGVEYIGNRAFFQCQALTQVTIPNTVTQMGDSAFEKCTALQSVQLPDQLTEIPYGAFCYCYNLHEINIPSGVTTIGEGAFYECVSLSELKLPEGLTAIENFAFGECYELKEIAIPSNVTSIGEGVFAYTDALKSIVIPKGITTLEANLFYDSGIQSIVIPQSVTAVGEAAFAECNDLSLVIFCGTEDQFAAITYGDFNEKFTQAQVQYHDFVDGKCRYCGEADSNVRELIKWVGTQLQATSNLDMQFALRVSDLGGTTGNYIVLTRTYADGRADDVVTIPQEKWTTSSSFYIVAYSGIAAKEMNDMISAVVYNADGEVISETRSESIVTYALSMLGKITNEEQKTMFVDLLNYGAEAQKFFHYNEEHLANAGLTEAQKALGTQGDIEVADHRVKGENFVGSQLSLENVILLQMAFKVTPAEGMYAVVTYTDHNGKSVSNTLAVENNAGFTMVSVNSLAIADYRTLVTCTVYNADGEIVGSAVDSMESYVARSGNDLGAAIMKFGASAYAYFH